MIDRCHNENCCLNTFSLALLVSICQGSFAQAEDEDEPNYRDQAQIMYVAYYGRPGDVGGLDYWAAKLKEVNGKLSEIINNFGNSKEFQDRFGDLSVEELVNNLYLLLGRDADSGGLNFYVNGLREGKFTPASIALNLADGTRNNPRDDTIKANKLRAAKAFTQAYVEAGATYGELQIDEAKRWLAEVGEVSVTAALYIVYVTYTRLSAKGLPTTTTAYRVAPTACRAGRIRSSRRTRQ